jgi:hypothetical protein
MNMVSTYSDGLLALCVCQVGDPAIEVGGVRVAECVQLLE